MRRGDILAILPGERILVLDSVATHLAAALYASSASQLAGFAAQRQKPVSIALSSSSVMAWAMNSCLWLVSLLEGWVKRQPASSLTSVK